MSQVHASEWEVRPDTDPRRAAHTRRRVLDRGVVLAGAHLDALPIHRIHHNGDGAYRFEPADRGWVAIN